MKAKRREFLQIIGNVAKECGVTIEEQYALFHELYMNDLLKKSFQDKQ